MRRLFSTFLGDWVCINPLNGARNEKLQRLCPINCSVASIYPLTAWHSFLISCLLTATSKITFWIPIYSWNHSMSIEYVYFIANIKTVPVKNEWFVRRTRHNFPCMDSSMNSLLSNLGRLLLYWIIQPCSMMSATRKRILCCSNDCMSHWIAVKFKYYPTGNWINNRTHTVTVHVMCTSMAIWVVLCTAESVRRRWCTKRNPIHASFWLT